MNPREFCREKGFNSTILLTYNFDPIFFERVVLRELWAGETGDTLVIADRNQIAQSAERWGGQLRELGRRYQLSAARTSGAFHPKLIVRVGQQGAAVWLGSGNVTAGGWGVNRELAAGWAIGPNSPDQGGWLLPLLQRVAEWGPETSQHNVIRRIFETSWVERLAGVSEPEGNKAILTSYGDLSLASQLLNRWGGRRFDQVFIYTGSSDENGAFLKWLYDNFGIARSVVVASQGSVSFLQRMIDAFPMEASVMRLGGLPPIHAKFYWLTGRDGSAAIMGSANCSAAAWLNPPARGGNVEAVAIYDQPLASDFAPILQTFQSNDLIPIELGNTRNLLTRGEAHTGPTIAEVAWRDDLGTLIVTLNQSEHRIDEVSVELANENIRMSPVGENTMRWAGESSRLTSQNRTSFVTVKVRYDETNQLATTAWINDVNELRHASQGRRLVDALLGLGRATGSSEQQELIRMLSRIGRALLNEPEAFPDPLFVQAKTNRENEQAAPTKPINPEEFIRSLNELDTPAQRALAVHSGASLSLSGVMRALFSIEAEAFDEEAEFIDETDDDKPKRRSDRKKRAGKPAIENRPDERVRERLRRHIDECINRLSERDFAEHCTASQLIQSVAYPIAVATLGMPTGWVDDSLAREWATRVFDVLFRQNETGLLQEVQARYRNKGKEADFVRIIGDGTLWLALLTALSLPAWEGENGGFEKALAIRSVAMSRELIASTEAGRMGALIANLDERRARAVMRIAQKAITLLTTLEETLEQDFDRILELQRSHNTVNSGGDLLWKPKAGWAECQNSSPWGEKLNAYLHLRADIRQISSKLFINVTRAASEEPQLSKMLDELRRL